MEKDNAEDYYSDSRSDNYFDQQDSQDSDSTDEDICGSFLSRKLVSTIEDLLTEIKNEYVNCTDTDAQKPKVHISIDIESIKEADGVTQLAEEKELKHMFNAINVLNVIKLAARCL